jgi:rubredoxin
MRIIESKKVRTRKVHECVGCLRKLSAGTEMNIVTSVDLGEINHSYWCPVCQYIYDETIFGEDNIIFPGVMRADNPEYWEEIRQEVESK